jgi:hypothetical protein
MGLRPVAHASSSSQANAFFLNAKLLLTFFFSDKAFLYSLSALATSSQASSHYVY